MSEVWLSSKEMEKRLAGMQELKLNLFFLANSMFVHAKAIFIHLSWKWLCMFTLARANCKEMHIIYLAAKLLAC